LLEQLEPGNPAYNIPLAIRLQGSVDIDLLNRTLNEVVARHEALRTTIAVQDEQPVQIIGAITPQALRLVSLEHLDPSERDRAVAAQAQAEARAPFSLEQGPLFRAALLRLSPSEHVAVVVVHHIIADDWSMGLLFQDVAALYHALLEGRTSPLRSLPIQYADFAVWQRGELQGERLSALLDVWCRRLRGVPNVELPYDRPRTLQTGHAGGTARALLPAALAQHLRELGRREGATLYMTLLAGFQILLYRYSGQEDFAVGSPVAGRVRKETEGLFGLFANTLVMRANLAGRPSFREVLRRVRDVSLEAFQHQELPYERVVEALNPERDASRHPLFQVALTLQNAPWPEVRLADLTLSSLPLACGAAKLDLWMTLRESASGLQSELEYRSGLFDADTAERMLGHYRNLLESGVASPDQALDRLPWLAARERQQVLVEWNDTARDYDFQCLPALIESRLEQRADEVAVVFQSESLTGRALNEQANALAHYLIGAGVGPDVPVGVCLERSLEMVVSLLAILKAGGAYVPLDPDLPPDRLRAILQDCRPAAVLTTRALEGRLPAETGFVLRLDEAAEELARHPGDNPAARNALDDVAYVIYTSGSTGAPKGVRNTHRGICNRLLWMQEAYGLTPLDRVLQKTPFGFDVSLWEFFWPLLAGARLVLAKPGGHKDPRYVAHLLVEQGITTVHFVPSMLRAFLAEEASARCIQLKRVFCSGEALPYGLTRQFFARLPAELHNLYGPTEAAVDATCWQCGENALGLVPIGRPIANTRCYILDSQGGPLPVGVPGELHLGGVGLARDYLNRPELTAERFIPDPFSDRPGARLYKTGDLCSYLPDGNIRFMGRLDDQVKIRGNRVEPGEVQAALAKHPAVAAAAVTTWADDHDGAELAAYWVAEIRDQPPEANALREFLLASLPDYMVPSTFVRVDAIPLGPNGKLDRAALPRPARQRDQSCAYVSPRNPDEERLAEIWRDVLRVEPIGVHDNFFSLGGHSLLAAQVVSRIAGRLMVELPLRDLFQAPTIAQLALLVAALRSGGHAAARTPIPPLARDGELRLSFTQESLWFLDQLERDRPTYTIHLPLRIRGLLNAATLEQAMHEILRRHEALRTTFPEVNGRPAQVVTPPDSRPLAVRDLSSVPAAEREAALGGVIRAETAQPLDLQRGPLIRFTLVRLASDDHVALVSAHHIVYDGWSMGVLLRELAALYAAFEEGRPSPLPELPIQYADFAAWQRQRLQGPELARLREYWVRQLAGVPPLELPTDFPRPLVRTTRGAARAFGLPPDLGAALREFCRQDSVTPFMTLLAVFEVLLQRYSGQEDFAIGSPVANRTRPETESLVGYFVNVLVLRSDLAGGPSFRELLRRVRAATLGAFEHEELTLDQVVQAVNPPRDLRRHPLFQVMFALQNIDLPALEAAGLQLTPYDADTAVRSSYFELTLGVWQTGASFRAELEYSTDLFADETIERMGRHYEQLLRSALAEPDRPVCELALLPVEERQQVLVGWNQTAAQIPGHETVHRLFEAQAARTPDAVAVVCDTARWTYRELNERSNKLARWLKRQGVTPDTRVGIALDRSPELVMAVLGVLKAGGAYVPMDPAYALSAVERQQFIVRDATVAGVVTSAALVPALAGISVPHFVLDGPAGAELRHAASGNLEDEATAESLAYVLYTSGSTGRPKGVMISHRNWMNAYHGWEQVYRLRRDVGSHLQMASFGFDVFAGDLVRALGSGGKLVLCPKETLLDASELAALMKREQVDIAEFVPIVMRNLVQHLEEAGERLDSARLMIVGSDTWFAADHKRARRVLGAATRLVNSYGLTETTIDSTYFEGDVSALPDTAVVPIGRPFPNVRVYILDSSLNPVPIGVPGDLYIGGRGVSRGYVNPDLNASRFLPDPFVPGPSALLCRTEDRARWRPDGQVEFLGRADRQVKIRGFRVEPGEVEQLLREHPSLSDAAVVARERTAGDLQLVAYVTGSSTAIPDVAELREYLAKRVAGYMLPAAFVTLAEWPTTASGKIDRQALPGPDWSRAAPGVVHVAPRTETERQLAIIWSELLGQEHIGIDDNFFELGGHSLLLVRLMATIRETFAVELRLVRLFTAPTIAGLAHLVDGIRDGTDPDSSGAGPHVDWEREMALDPGIRVTPDLTPAAEQPSRILLTGATGFLGAFLLRELLEQTTADLYCLVRAGSPEEARAKIVASLERYELETRGASERIFPVCGDLTRPMLGWTAELWEDLAGRVDAIYHNGARVSSVYPYSLLKPANVAGTVEVLRLATRTKVKPVHFVSTLSVLDAPEYQRDSRPDEQQVPATAAGLASGYAQSKAVAEQLVRAAAARGVPVSVYRPGRISGDSRTGAGNAADETAILLRLCIELGMAPEVRADASLDMTPVDFVARAIVGLARRRECMDGTFHLLNPRPVALREIYDAIRSMGYALQEVPFPQWRSRAIEHGARSQDERLAGLAHLLTTVGPATPMGALGEDGTRPPAMAACDRTASILERDSLGCPRVDATLLSRYLQYLGRAGIIASPPPGSATVSTAPPVDSRHASPASEGPEAAAEPGADGEKAPAAYSPAGSGHRHRSLVLLQQGGTGVPCFCFHGLGGHVAVFLPLSRELAPERPVFGLQAPELDLGPQSGDTIVSMASDCVREICEVREQGPYLLAGWSMGGLLALEAARQLRAAGHRVGLLALLDTRLSAGDVGRQEIEENSLLRWIAPRVAIALEELQQLPLDRQWQAIAERVARADWVGADEVRRLAAVCLAQLAAVARYEAEVYPEPAVLFQAEAARVQLDERWAAFCPRLTVERVPGNHYSLLRKPHVEVLARHLRRHFGTALAGESRVERP
jgi:amino acid adenylation domain-containing protein/thioester reductase-like protein